MDLNEALKRGMAGEPLSVDEALALDSATASCTDALCDAADSIRRHLLGATVHTCSIVNARSGRCPEDCKWCAQSAHHHTGVNEYEYISAEDMLSAYAENAARGVRRFSLVTSGRRVPKAHMQRFLDLYARARQAGNMELCASMGLLDAEQMRQLRQAGVSRYHCNLETGSEYFPKLCSTHSHADKLATIRAAREAGLEVCCGGIIGMGESLRDRLMLAAEAREAGAASIPVNLLCPIPGTPLEHQPPLPEQEVVRSVALMRFVAPRCVIFFAGGRAKLSERSVRRMLRGGANGALVGNMLTTVGNDMDSDFELFRSEGYSI